MKRDDMPPQHMELCPSCNAPIVWTKTDRGARHPVEVEPSPTGNLRLSIVDGEVHSHKVADKLAFGHADLHLSHFVLCPQAASHRRRPTTRRHTR
jgi:hypothetical protein